MRSSGNLKTPRRPPIVPVGLVLFLLAVSAFAVAPEQWRFRTGSDFEGGVFTSISIDVGGGLRLAPRLEELYTASDPYLWSLAVDADGVVYAGSGNEGRVYRVAPGSDGQLFFDSDELEVHAVAISPDGRVYVGTSPRGRVYRFDADGRAEVFFDPGQTYIWELAFLPDGDLLVATGSEGLLYRVGPDGEAETLFDAEDTHIRTILVGADGSVVAGTSGQGLVVRIAPDGAPFVLYDSPLDEIVDLAGGSDGSIYAAALSPQKRVARPEIQDLRAGGQAQAQAQQQAAKQKPVPRKSSVYRIDPEGVATEHWSTSQDNIFCLYWSGDDALLVGTGDEGRVLEIAADGEVSERIRTGSAQVTAIAAAGEGDLYIATSNLGFLSRLGSGSAAEGEYLSTVKDTRTVSEWGNLSWKGEVPRGTSIRMMVRTGNTRNPDRTWSDWSEPLDEADGTRIDRPRARYIQWKAMFRSGRGDATPILNEVMLAYLQKNLAPQVRTVMVMPPGTHYQKVATSTRTSAPEQQIQSGSSPSNGNTNMAQQKPGSTQIRSRTGAAPRGVRSSYETGSRSVRWTADDANGDSLSYSVFFRGEGEKLWKVLAEDIDEEFTTWDETAMPDGVYEIRVVATDRPSNPQGEALSGEKLSGAFFVDHTPPRVENLEAEVRSGRAEVTFLATDSFSPIEAVQYSIDAQEWRALYPVDRVADSITESFRFETGDLVSGEHTIVVRASDDMGNRGTGKIILEIP